MRVVYLKKLLIVTMAGTALLFAAGCGGKEPETAIALPADPEMRLTLGWGVVLTNYIRIRATPSADGTEITALAKGAVVQVLERDRRETVRDVTDLWYKIDTGQSRGWLFGKNVAVFHTREEAEAYREGMQ